MMILPFRTTADGEYALFVVLEKENVDRMRIHDPAEVLSKNLGPAWQGLRMDAVIIAYANPEEAKQFTELCQAGKPLEAMKLLSRGFRFRPGDGDRDGKYESAL